MLAEREKADVVDLVDTLLVGSCLAGTHCFVHEACRLVAAQVGRHARAHLVRRQLLLRELEIAVRVLPVLSGFDGLDRAAAKQAQKMIVRHAGDAALVSLVERFDRVRLEHDERVDDFLDRQVGAAVVHARVQVLDRVCVNWPNEHAFVESRHSSRYRVPRREKDAHVVRCEHKDWRHVDRNVGNVDHGQAQRATQEPPLLDRACLVAGQDVLDDLVELVVLRHTAHSANHVTPNLDLSRGRVHLRASF